MRHIYDEELRDDYYEPREAKTPVPRNPKEQVSSKEIVARLQRMAGGHSCNKEGCLDCFYRTAAREIERLLEADRLLQQSWMRPAGEVDQNHLEQEVWNYFGRASDETFADSQSELDSLVSRIEIICDATNRDPYEYLADDRAAENGFEGTT